jgi:hypothetical protein
MRRAIEFRERGDLDIEIGVEGRRGCVPLRHAAQDGLDEAAAAAARRTGASPIKRRENDGSRAPMRLRGFDV